jgi:hypothetical protein
MWRAACHACDMGALFDTEAEAVDALGEHMASHGLWAPNRAPGQRDGTRAPSERPEDGGDVHR